jgi:hypothetical protein
MNTALRLTTLVMTAAIGSAALLVTAPVQAADAAQAVPAQRVEIVGKRLTAAERGETPAMQVVIVGKRLPRAVAAQPVQRAEAAGQRSRSAAALPELVARFAN